MERVYELSLHRIEARAVAQIAEHTGLAKGRFLSMLFVGLVQ